jgi:hypothetical protein
MMDAVDTAPLRSDEEIRHLAAERLLDMGDWNRPTWEFSLQCTRHLAEHGPTPNFRANVRRLLELLEAEFRRRFDPTAPDFDA